MPLSAFHPAVQHWFAATLGEPSDAQRRGWPSIAAGTHTLIAAPTGSGKTLAAFLSAIDALVRRGLRDGALPDAVQVVYVSPLKALSADIEQNLQRPLAGIAAELQRQGLVAPEIRSMLRTGDTPMAERARFAKRPPHILVTTPESLYILLTTKSGRQALAQTQTLIVDEIHAVLADKRGAHLALSMERLDALCEGRLTRIGLSATQKPIERTAAFLAGHDGHAQRPCAIVDVGLRTGLDLALELPSSPLEAVMAGEVWEELYDRLATLVNAHRTTLVFVNTRRLAERVARHLAERLGEERVGAHHGSLSREHRLRAEQRLRSGELSVLVATASLELGIDIGHVELVCQLGTTRSIAAFIQRVGRSGHFLGGTPKGRLFPLSISQLAEAAALLHAVRQRDLDEVALPAAPLDILAQQIVAELAAVEELDEDALFALVRRAAPYRELGRERFEAVLEMLADGFDTARGRRGALLHRDRVNHRLRPRRGARLTAVTSGGAIPDNADYGVVLEPEGLTIGTLNEDFAIESMAGDIFQLGNRSYRIRRVETGTVRVEDAHGAPPSIPFWLGEAPARSAALSQQLWALTGRIESALDAAGGEPARALAPTTAALEAEGLPAAAAQQLAEYFAAAKSALGVLPNGTRLVVERFFDEAGGMQLVIHSPHGSRLNRGFGLALRKRFCRSFNFELQAAATEDAIVLSLGPTHSFPLEDVKRMLRSSNVRELLVQALLDAPMFETRFRWNANRALAVPRFGGGRKVPPFLQRMRANDLLSTVFPDQQACQENVQGDRRVPEHPLVQQSVDDCLREAMDIEGLEKLLQGLEHGTVTMVFRDLTEPSVLAHEVLNANPYAFLDDAPLEERRTRAVSTGRGALGGGGTLAELDTQAIARVREEAWPDFTNADELHDALCGLGFLRDAELPDTARAWMDALLDAGRAVHFDAAGLWGSTERLPELLALFNHPSAQPLPGAKPCDPERARHELVRGRLDSLGPTTARAVAESFGQSVESIDAALHALEAEGAILRGRFEPGVSELQWCERRLLARIHRRTLERLRKEIEPVSIQTLLRFLLRWQHLAPGSQLDGPAGLSEVLEQLAGHSASALAWEGQLLPGRVQDYDPAWLDQLCLSGRFSWLRRASEAPGRGVRPLRSTPIAILPRPVWASAAAFSGEPPSAEASAVLAHLERAGASFFADLRAGTGLLPTQLEAGLAELVSRGRITADAFAGLRALLVPAARRTPHPLRAGRSLKGSALPAMEQAGRWSLLAPEPANTTEPEAALEAEARRALHKWGVVFRRLLERETGAPWRELLRVYRRLEARGELRGGRFVAGFTGEQFALPEAVEALRELGKQAPDGTQVVIGAADPLNLVGSILPGERVAARTRNRVLLRDGLPVAVLEGGEVRWLSEQLDEAARWQAQLALRRHQIPGRLRALV
jgi:ATP-dependent Lhr-like helicase